MSDSAHHQLAVQIQQLQRSRRRWKYFTFGTLALAMLLAVAAQSSRSQQGTGSGEAPQVSFHPSGIPTYYSNYVRVTGTPEEVVLDFGLNAPNAQKPGEGIMLNHRLVMTFYTAKRLALVLEQSIKQHETSFGTLELDAQKRMQHERKAEERK